MIILAHILFWILLITLLVSKLTRWERKNYFRFFRVLLAVCGWSFIGYWVYTQTSSHFGKNDIGVRVNNHSSKTINFYLIQRDEDGNLTSPEKMHLGEIRKNHYRLEPANLKNGKEFWLAGFIDHDEKMFLYRQIYVLNPNEDVSIDVEFPFIQSSEMANRMNNLVKSRNVNLYSDVILLTFDLLMLFVLSIIIYRDFKSKKLSA